MIAIRTPTLIFGVLFLAAGLMGCDQGKINSHPKASVQNGLSWSLEDYDTTRAIIRLSGELKVPLTPDLAEVDIFGDSGCTGTPLAKGLIENLQDAGLTLEVPIDGASLFFRTNLSTDCVHLIDARPQLDPVPPPVFERTEPASPSKVNYTPGLFGRIFPSTATIEFFADPECLNHLGSGTAESFSGYGVSISLNPEAMTQIHAQSVDPRGVRSVCTHLTDYLHSSSPAENPIFHRTEPLSPSNESATPVLIGSVPESSVRLDFYSDPACSEQIGSGTREQFISTGVQASVAENSSTSIYARAENDEGKKSACLFMTTYVHDTVAPQAPTFSAADPPTPTRLTTFPKIKGSAESDVSSIRFYRASACLPAHLIGAGTRAVFQNSGIPLNLVANSTTEVYAAAFDAAGNRSACVHFLDYRHNTIPPDQATFMFSDPTSPTNSSTTPRLYGQASDRTVSLRIYSENECLNQIGVTTPQEFSENGIEVSVASNSTNMIHAIALDEEGNEGECAFLTAFSHSDQPAPNPTFTLSIPASPTRQTTSPTVIGSAPSTVSTIELFSDGACSTSLGSTSRMLFATAGLSINVEPNAASAIYARSTDIYGNSSNCSLLTSFVHTVLPPNNPTFSAVTPLSPNNSSTSPTLQGTVTSNPASPLPVAKVSFYDNSACISKLGEGSASQFNGAGIPISVSPNALTTIYAKSFDQVSNGSACVHMTDYIHNSLKPGKPLFISANPGTPSYNRVTSVRGTYASSPDFMPRTQTTLFSDAGCSQVLATGPAESFSDVGGISVTVPANQTTQIYGASQNALGTWSDCSSLIPFRHHDLPHGGFSATQLNNGGVLLNWLPDGVPQPQPTYRVKRATHPDGPYTIIQSGGLIPSFTDQSVTQGKTYYYRIQGTNSTGYSQETAPLSVDILAPVTSTPFNVIASPSAAAILLAWSGSPSNMSYRVFRSTSRGGPYAPVSGLLTNVSTFQDTGLVNGTPYYYVVRAYNPAEEGVQSNEVRAIPLANPGPPGNFRISPQLDVPECAGGPGIKIEWTPPAYYSGFTVYRTSDDSTVSWDTTETEMVDCNPSNYDTARNLYRVVTRWGSTQSVATSDLIFWHLGPNSLSAFPGNDRVALFWSSPRGSVVFDVYRTDSFEGQWELILDGTASTSHIDSISNGDTRFYYVVGRDGTEYVGWPSATQMAMPMPSPTAPTHLTLIPDPTGLSAQLTWRPPTHFNRFVVYRSTVSAGGPFEFLAYSSTPSATVSALNGVNHYQVVAQWGDEITAASNTVSFRRAPVSNLALTRTNDSLNLTWLPVSGVADYEIVRSTSESGEFSPVGITTSTTYSDTSALVGVGYFYRVRARFSDGNHGQYSSIVSGLRLGTNAPSGLTLLSAGNANLNIQWILPSSTITQVRVHTSTDIGGPYNVAQTLSGTSTTVNITGLLPRTKYWIRVGATVGGTEHLSTPVDFSTLTTPSSPGVSSGSGEVLITWMGSIGVTDYAIERTSDFLNVTPVASGLVTTSYTDNTVVDGNLYFYRLILQYSSGSVRSPWSAAAFPGLIPLAPNTPFISENITGTSIFLSWMPSYGANQYALYQASNPAGPFGAPIMTTSGTSNIEVTGLNPAESYFYRVTALTNGIESPPSGVAGVIPGVPLAAPSVEHNGVDEATVTWSPVAGASTYNLERATGSGNFMRLATGLGSPSYDDSDLHPDLTYLYRYRPVGAQGEEFPLSEISLPIVVGLKPSPPGAPSAEAIDGSTIRVTWALTSGAISYTVHRSPTQGSGHTLIATVDGSTSTYDDSGLAADTSYYYFVRSQNATGGVSDPSTEVAASTSSVPTGLMVADSGRDVTLSWNAVGGAESYIVGRGENPSGPFSVISTTTDLSAEDNTTEPGKTYHYAVAARFANNSDSPWSAASSLTKAGFLDLVSVIEMIESPIQSSSISSTSFMRSQTRIVPIDYDGVSDFVWEIVAVNHSASPVTIDLLDQTDSVIDQLAIPASTVSPLRLESSFAFPATETTYRLRLPQTLLPKEVEISSSRLKIQQTNATKTRLYFPLFAAVNTGSEDDSPVFSTNLGTHQSPDGIGYVRNASKLSSLLTYNAWELETVSRRETDAVGEITLRNRTLDQVLNSVSVEIKNDSLRIGVASFSEGITLMSPSEEGHVYDVGVRCIEHCDSGSIQLHRAGLWVRLTNLTKAQILLRTSPRLLGLASDQAIESHRQLMPTFTVSNQTTRWRVRARNQGSGPATISIRSTGTADQGPGPWSLLGDSEWSVPASGLLLDWTSPPLSPTGGHRYLPEISGSPSDIDLVDSYLLIDID